MTPLVRPGRSSDAAAIAELLGQLGYPATSEEVIERLGPLRAFQGAIVLVAETDGRIVGVAAGHVFPSIHSTSVVAWLTTLVVREGSQRSGIGRQLAASVEEWARHAGAARISVTSGLHRDGAHAFYERLGYARTGVRLTKALT